jgi:ketosteroid isomerase-like protein
MKTAILTTAGLMTAFSAVAQTPNAEVCRKGADERVVEIASPGKVGLACDVVYVRNGGADVSVPYNANADRNFCRARAAELVATLIADGFACAPLASPDLEAALAGGAQTSVAAAAPVPVASAIDSSEHDAGAAPSNGAAVEGTPAIVATAESAPADLPLNEQLEKLDQPAATLTAATSDIIGAPTQLATDARPIEYRAPRPSTSTGAGRLVGPPPSLDGIVDATAIAPPAEPAKTEAIAVASVSARPVEDVVKGVLAASAAAWNEGNLEAFLTGYADAPDVVLMMDGATATGIESVRKKFLNDAAIAGGMGRIAYDGLAVTLTAENVVTVVGRYAFANAVSKSAGVMTLVMKQTNGRWRIVNDTRIADAAP